MSDSDMDTTVELDRAEVLAALQRSKQEQPASATTDNDDLRNAIQTIKRWAEDNEQWLVVLAPWGMHHYGTLSEEQVEQILKRFSPND